MTDPKKKAPSAGEELEKEALQAERDVTGERERRGQGEAGDSLTPSRTAQRQAHGENGGKAGRDTG